MKKILVPTDFSDLANNALDLAVAIADKINAELLVLNVVEMVSYQGFNTSGSVETGDPMDQIYIQELVKHNEAQIQDLIDEPKFKNVNISGYVQVGNAYTSISEDITKNDVDLVIMGSKGASGIEEILLGSNTEKVVRYSKVPVLTVKGPVEIKDLNSIVFASDLSHDTVGHIKELKKLQKALDATIHLVKVNTPNNFETSRTINAQMDKFVEENELENCTKNIYNDVSEEDGIIYFAEDVNADIIALATHGRTGLLHLLSGSIAEDVVNHAKRPVWTFSLREKK